MAVDPYASGVLKKEVHERLVDDLAAVAGDAAIQPRWVWTRLADVCTPKIVQWVTRFRFHANDGRYGLALVGENAEFVPEEACAAIAGALVRNFIRARVVTVQDLVLATQDGEVPKLSCLLVPNFFAAGQKQASQSQWRLTLLLDALISRQMAGLQTVVCVSDLAAMEKDYGRAFRRHLEDFYQPVEVV